MPTRARFSLFHFVLILFSAVAPLAASGGGSASVQRVVRQFLARHPEISASETQIGRAVRSLGIVVRGERWIDAAEKTGGRAGAERQVLFALRAAGAVFQRPDFAARNVPASKTIAQKMPASPVADRRTTTSASSPIIRGAVSNDDCANALEIGLASDDNSTIDATNDGSADCGDSTTSPDIWYHFTAPDAGPFYFDTLGSQFDTVLSIHSACPGTEGNQLSCDDDQFGSLRSGLLWLAGSPGDGVYIRVAGYGGRTGQVHFTVSRPGKITGKVTAEGSGDPLGDVEIRLGVIGGGDTSAATSQSDGTYETELLPSGPNFYLATTVGDLSPYLDELYHELPCDQGCPPQGGTPITVPPGGSTDNVDFTLALGGKITGKVTDSLDQPLQGIQLVVLDASGNDLAHAETQSDGTYETLPGLPSGTYYVQTYDTPLLLDEIYDNVPCASHCDPLTGAGVAVTAGSTTPGIDFQLVTGGTISGTVTEETSNTPLDAIDLRLFDADGFEIDYTQTAGDGTYLFSAGLPTGTYTVLANPIHNWVGELWNNHPCVNCDPANGDGVAVTLGLTTPNINFALALGGKVSGTVTRASDGAPLENVDVYLLDSTGYKIDAAGTASDGTYQTSLGLPSGTYHAVTRNSDGYIDEREDGAVCIGSCDPAAGAGFGVTAPSVTSGVDFALAAGGGISGTIVDSPGGHPQPSSAVRIFDEAGGLIEEDAAQADGSYTMQTGLPTGNYRAAARDYDHLVGQLYPDLPCPFALCPVGPGDPIPVLSPLVTPGIDFALEDRPIAADGFESAGFGGWTNGSGAAPLCAHPICEPDPVPLAAGCDPCVDLIRAANPYCTGEWSPDCVEDTYTVCGVTTCEWIWN